MLKQRNNASKRKLIFQMIKKKQSFKDIKNENTDENHSFKDKNLINNEKFEVNI